MRRDIPAIHPFVAPQWQQKKLRVRLHAGEILVSRLFTAMMPVGWLHATTVEAVPSLSISQFFDYPVLITSPAPLCHVSRPRSSD